MLHSVLCINFSTYMLHTHNAERSLFHRHDGGGVHPSHGSARIRGSGKKRGVLFACLLVSGHAVSSLALASSKVSFFPLKSRFLLRSLAPIANKERPESFFFFNSIIK